METEMKKIPAKYWAIVGIAGVLLIVLLCCLMPGKKNEQPAEITNSETETEMDVAEPEKVIQIEEKVEKELLVLDLITRLEDTPSYVEKMNSLRTWEIADVAMEDGQYVATVKIQVPDLYEIVMNMEAEENLTEEQMDADLTEALDESTLVEKEVTVVLVEMEDGLEIQPNEEFLDAYFGGILQIREKLYEEGLGGTSDEE